MSSIARGTWPKILPPLTQRQREVADDFMNAWVAAFPTRFGAVNRFNHGYPLRFLPPGKGWRTLEIGAGRGSHIPYEDLSAQEYHCVELRPMLHAALQRAFPAVKAVVGDCQERLPYEDGWFDRALAIHVLEHLPNLPAAVGELRRVLRPGGILSVVIPCDPGLLYALARKVSAERMFRRRYRMPYGWLYRREHINGPQEIRGVLAESFAERDCSWFPFRVPSVHANLCIGLTLIRR